MTNKPRLISIENLKNKQSYFGMIIGELVPERNPFWLGEIVSLNVFKHISYSDHALSKTLKAEKILVLQYKIFLMLPTQ